MEEAMKKLLDLGFKKIKTEPGFHMYELTPARLPVASNKPQATSSKRQATSSRLRQFVAFTKEKN
jgi:hypothetical protein